MLCRGTRVILELSDGEKLKPPGRNGLLHDTEGRSWAKNVVLVGPFQKGGKIDEVPARVRQYLGRTATIHRGEASTESLPRRLGQWERIGDLAVLYYCRGGTKARGCFHHELNKSAINRAVHGHGKVTVYKYGQWYRLQFPRGARMDDRGFLYP